jgi:hypothetical protein
LPRHCVFARSIEPGWYGTLIDSLSLRSDSPQAPVKRGDTEVKGYSKESYTPQYYEPYKYDEYGQEKYYSPKYTPTYNYEYEAYPTSTYEYKPEKTYGWDYKYYDKSKYDNKYQYYKPEPKYYQKWQEPPKFLCQLPPKEAPWYGEYYKWACTSIPRLSSVSPLNLLF